MDWVYDEYQWTDGGPGADHIFYTYKFEPNRPDRIVAADVEDLEQWTVNSVDEILKFPPTTRTPSSRCASAARSAM